ncbi:MarR family winged helix-turn-helix transcriptional regulator [Streptomyces sp. UNOC14_S4]|uniref:MarR family winged helix-turn-helix transcriptional regulator n=1 Tax=Streptomyces sp. UNOC14_S4 TaxID=2872340 RepID=UPI001E4C0897|nr:MarR family winged helix-turn-helix transcriptional regulator [Streptomyces sp. UNOC14_S4]MCC3770542.1 MarR family winged helix-turn-helix transcriptional regulator [Streptomyces sp. UNOC14_S4]
MKYSHDDAGLLQQPIGYWATAAGREVVTSIRTGLAGFGTTQPQWWVLNRSGETREQLTAVLLHYVMPGDDLDAEIDGLVGRGLITFDEGNHLRLTEAGEKTLAQCAAWQKAHHDRIHDGVSDEEYLATLKVLQRMIHNVDGKAWHH